MTQAQAKPPGPYFEKGRPLAESFKDGSICGSRYTLSGEPCDLPRRYGRDEVSDPSDSACYLHADDAEKCGEPTLLTGPCTLPAGHGVEGEDSGPCAHHREAAQEGRRIRMAEFLVYLGKTLTVTEAAKRAGVSRYSIYLWANRYEEFDRAIQRLLNGEVARARLERAEEVLWERVTGDEAGQAERIFFLVNASSDGEGWRDVKYVRHDHRHSGGVLVAPATPDGDDWEEAAQHQQAELKERTGTGGREIEATVREAREVE